jgi:hypothetical protein
MRGFSFKLELSLEKGVDSAYGINVYDYLPVHFEKLVGIQLFTEVLQREVDRVFPLFKSHRKTDSLHSVKECDLLYKQVEK